jgi:SulP family sulfate permease
MVAVFGLIDIKYPRFLWKTRKEDFIMLMIAFIVTLAVGIKEGILLSVVISLVAMIYRSTKPHYAVLGKFPNSKVFRNIDRFDGLVIREDILTIRYDADLYFANISHFIDSIKKEVAKKGSKLKLVIMQGNSIAHIDSSAYLALSELILELDKQNIIFYFSDLIGPTRDFLKSAGIDEVGEKEKSFVDVDSAITFFDKHFGSGAENSYS